MSLENHEKYPDIFLMFRASRQIMSAETAYKIDYLAPMLEMYDDEEETVDNLYLYTGEKYIVQTHTQAGEISFISLSEGMDHIAKTLEIAELVLFDFFVSDHDYAVDDDDD